MKYVVTRKKVAYRPLFPRPCWQQLCPTCVFSYVRHGRMADIEVFPLITKVYLAVTKVFLSVIKVFPLITKFFPLVTKVSTLVTKFFPLVTMVFPLVTKVFPSVNKVFSLVLLVLLVIPLCVFPKHLVSCQVCAGEREHSADGGPRGDEVT